MLESVSLLFASGKLCLFCDNKFSRVICDTLPLDKDLWGSVDVYGDCVEIQSELLTENDESKCYIALAIIILSHFHQMSIVPWIYRESLKLKRRCRRKTK